MIGKRIQPLLFLCFVGGLVLAFRLWQIQVVERDLWQVEAARLVHSGRRIPYERGRILDTRGRVVARDHETYELALVYREFRRGHPLGELAHARSLLEGRAVSLHEARASLLPWTRALLALTPRQVARFAEGAAFDTADARFAACDPRRQNRSRRAADLRFYVRRILDLEPRAWKRLSERGAEDGADRSFLELAAALPDPETGARRTADELARAIDEKLLRSVEDLDRLARRLPRDDGALDDALLPAAPPLDRLIDTLEETRRWVEDAAAAKLFVEALGFAPGRVEPDLLLRYVDLSWICSILAWDDRRLVEWARDVRAGWLTSWRDGYALAHLCADLRLDPAREPGPDDVLDRLVALFEPEGTVEALLDGQARPWRAAERLAVLETLDGALAADLPAALSAASQRFMPFQAPALRAVAPAGATPWSALDRLAGERAGRDAGARLARLVAGRSRADADALFVLCRALADDQDAKLQQGLSALVVALFEHAEKDELGPDGRLLVAGDQRERAAERAEFILKDYGMRPRPLQRQAPDYDVVNLLTRYERSYPGFEAREARLRDYPVQPGDDASLVAMLIGKVSTVNVDDLQRQRREATRLRELWNQPERDSEEELELLSLVGSVLRPDEVKGVAGVEGFWDRELTGRNGYRETLGLQDAFDGSREERVTVRPAVDGQDLTLTIDLDVQRAAHRTLQFPEYVADESFDVEWYSNPVGAIVLLTPGGDVVAAASEPWEASAIADDAWGQRRVVLERTLRQPTFQPPGSVFKPFVAALALERSAFDPEAHVLCGPIERGGAGYQDIRCWRRLGHGAVDLDAALVGSCNAYFAWLGESLGDADLREAADLFGFGHPSGIRTPPEWDAGQTERLGMSEDVPVLFTPDRLSDFHRRLGGNGLGVVQATPMQLARATAGLATGALPRVRLVRRVGERDVPPEAPAHIPISERSLARVRRALMGVAADPGGTAHVALNARELGLDVAVKTGSADLTSRADDEGKTVIRKHTWVAGWTPVERPAAIFVIFVHDTHTTSSHGAVYVARQFLRQPETRAWLAARGVTLGSLEQGRAR